MSSKDTHLWSCFGSLVFDDAGEWANEFVLFCCRLAITCTCNIWLFPYADGNTTNIILIYRSLFSLKFNQK